MFNISERLEIVVITYNREKYLKNTLKVLFADNSPVKMCKITVLDNNSSDGTSRLCETYQEKYSNFNYIRHARNVGWGNIALAYWVAKTEYVWVLADDDEYNWANWPQVEAAIKEKISVICCCNYLFNKNKKWQDDSLAFIQLTLLPAGIYRIKDFPDTVFRSMFENIYSNFPHMVFPVYAKNYALSVRVVDEVLKIGIHLEQTDCSYTRGSNREDLFPKIQSMSWASGFACICAGLNDRAFARETFELAVCQDWVYGSKKDLIRSVSKQYQDSRSWGNFADILVIVSPWERCLLLCSFCYRKIKSLLRGH